jgi:choline dehydrogenase-like flavoprotein
MRLSARQRRALEAICDTFVPAVDGLPSATELGVPDALLDAVEANPRRAERRQVAALLAAWDSAALGAAGGAGLHRFGSLDHPERERVLLAWSDSRLGQRRAAFQALRKAVMVLAYTLPVDGGVNPRWADIGYPGPPGPPASPPSPAVRASTPAAETTVDCDVCVVGSGAGGGTAASVLAAAGLDVVVLEAGEHLEEADFDGSEATAFRRMYAGNAAAATQDQSVGLLAGVCLGGGTVVNYTTSFRTPDEVRAEWARLGATSFASPAFDESLEAVWRRLEVNLDHNRPSSRDVVMRRGLEALGWHVEAMPRNVVGCDQSVVCGTCGLGCRLGAKRSTVRTWLADAQAHGARILVRTSAERVVIRDGRATGVDTRTNDGHQVRVRARAVVVACGALQTPALLRRSGVSNEQIGRHLRLHPVTAVFGVFDEEIRPWEGTMQALYSDELRDLHDGYGVKFETAPVHPGLAAGFLPWTGAAQSLDLMRQLPHVAGIGILLRDRDGGEVHVGRDGEPVARYRLSPFDVRHVRRGFAGAARILEAAGARRVMSAHTGGLEYRPGAAGGVDGFLREADAWGWGAGRCVFFSFHIMGTARMGGSAATSVCDPEGRVWNTEGLVVADGSVFPSAPGVNPMISIEAAAHMNASALAAALAG